MLNRAVPVAAGRARTFAPVSTFMGFCPDQVRDCQKWQVRGCQIDNSADSSGSSAPVRAVDQQSFPRHPPPAATRPVERQLPRLCLCD